MINAFWRTWEMVGLADEARGITKSLFAPPSAIGNGDAVLRWGHSPRQMKANQSGLS
jgi:hypothetical protein